MDDGADQAAVLPDLPSNLGTYFAALDRGDGAGAAGCFAPGAIMRLPASGASDTATQTVLRGAEIVEFLARRDPPTWTHDLALCITNGSMCFVEGEVRDAGTAAVSATFFVAVALDSDGLIEEYTAFRRTDQVRGVPPPAGTNVRAAELLQSIFARTLTARHVPLGLTDPCSSASLPSHRAHEVHNSDVVPLLTGMSARSTAEMGSIALAVGEAQHPDEPSLTVDYAISLALDGTGSVDRLVLYWAERDYSREDEA